MKNLIREKRGGVKVDLDWSYRGKGIKGKTRSWSSGSCLDWRNEVGSVTPSEITSCPDVCLSTCRWQSHSPQYLPHHNHLLYLSPGSPATHVVSGDVSWDITLSRGSPPVTAHERYLTYYRASFLAWATAANRKLRGPERGGTAIDLLRWRTGRGWRPEVASAVRS